MYIFENKCKILSGQNAIESISFEMQEKNLKKPLIISEKIIKELGVLKKITKSFNFVIKQKDVFSDISNQATKAVLDELFDLYKKQNNDSIIAIGRSSVISLAKALKYLINSNSESLEKINKEENKNTKTYLFVLPVFLGSTEEATAETTIYDILNHRTYIIKSEMCEPDAVFIDKRSMDIIPASVTVNTCGYAFLIALEAYASKDTNPLIQSYAQTSIQLIKNNLDKILKNPSKLSLQIPLVESIVYAGIAKSKVKLLLVDIIAKVISRLKQIPKEYVIFTMFLEEPSLFIEDKTKLEDLLTIYSGEEIASKTLQTDKANLLLNIVTSKLKSLAEIYDLPKGLYGLGVTRKEFQKIAEEVKFDIETKKINKDISVQEIQEVLNKIFAED